VEREGKRERRDRGREWISKGWRFELEK